MDMKHDAAVSTLSALAQPTRLQVMLVLSRAGEAGMLAGEIAGAIGTPHNTMSAHLAILQRAGLVEATKSGRNSTYRTVPGRVAELNAFLAPLTVGA
jgi:ArsR family transcriptional regulator, arsenate/arsenite/antimonite-responsive transcriptional repressor